MHRFLATRVSVAIACLLAGALNAPAGPNIFFATDDIYTSDYSSLDIKHYSSSGKYLNSLTVSNAYGGDVRGLAYGPDGLLYATISNGTKGFNVIAMDAFGAVQKSYSGPEYVGGNLSFGNIAFDGKGRFFVAGQRNLRQFSIGNPTGKVIYTASQVFDVEALPSENLLVLDAFMLQEITASGAVVRTIATYPGTARGVEYDAANNKIYVTGGPNFQLMRLDGLSGKQEESVFFWYGLDLYLTSDHRLLVGSRTQDVGIFDLDLNQQGSLTGGSQSFVTRLEALPEPSSIILAAIGMIVGAGYRQFRSRRTTRVEQ